MTRSIRFRTHGFIHIALTLGMLVRGSSSAWAQASGDPSPIPPRFTKEIDLSGPRFGFTMLSQETISALKTERNITVKPMISQFGWQFERRFYSRGDGVTALFEWVPLISGLDQGVALPSLNWLAGVRSREGFEFGIGPNLSPVGVGLVVAGGVTVRSGAMNVPLNFALASSKYGPRVTIMTGFTLRH